MEKPEQEHDDFRNVVMEAIQKAQPFLTIVTERLNTMRKIVAKENGNIDASKQYNLLEHLRLAHEASEDLFVKLLEARQEQAFLFISHYPFSWRKKKDEEEEDEE